MSQNTVDNACKCACHIPQNVQHGGLTHDRVCCDDLVGTLEWRAAKELTKKAEVRLLDEIDEYIDKNCKQQIGKYGRLGDYPTMTCKINSYMLLYGDKSMSSVHYFLLAENCIVDSEGKFSIINIFNGLGSSSESYVPPRFTFAVGVTPSNNEIKDGKAELKVQILDPNGANFFQAKGIGKVPKDKIGRPVVSPLDLSGRLNFKVSGKYKAELFVADKKQSELTFEVELGKKKSTTKTKS